MQQENVGGGGGDDGGDDNYIQILLAWEIAVVRLNDQQVAEIMNDNWNQQVRIQAIHIILTIGQDLQFSRRRLYRAVMYLDRFLAYRIMAGGIYRAACLLAAICLSWSEEMSVTPFDFTNFFVSRFCRDVSRRYITRARTFDIIVSVLRDARLMNHGESAIAAAATLLALNTNLTGEEVEIEINALPINEFLQIDIVCYCYVRLREMNPHI